MCQERERLIEYVYGECDPAERREVDAHLADCAECREEVVAFRQVRQDLLAWEVPEHRIRVAPVRACAAATLIA